MPMQLSLVMIRGDHEARVDAMLSRAGHRVTGRESRDVHGCLAWTEAAKMIRSADRPCEVIRVAKEGNWTLLSDETGAMVDALAMWQEVARELETAVVAVLHSQDEWSFAVFGPDGLVRAVVVDEDEVTERGDALPIEQLFSGKARLEDLTLLISSFGVDFDRTNLESSYRLVEVEVAA
jgi:hypothetical protein